MLRRRLAAPILVSLLLHALILGGLPRWTFTSRPSGPSSITVTLKPKDAQSPPPTPETAQPQTKSEPRSARPATQKEPLPIASLPGGVLMFDPSLASSVASAVPRSRLPAPEIPAAVLQVPAVAAETQPAQPSGPRPLPAGSATLSYKVVGTEARKDPPTMYYGSGTITWKLESKRYDLDLQARLNILFVSLSVLSSHSEGGIDDSGLAPARYTETPRNKSTLAVNFNRDDRRSITFSASTNSLPLTAGVQDRLSVVLQLGALVRADPRLAQPDAGIANIDLAVAGTRGDVDVWRFAIVGTESIETDAGAFQTVHLARSMRQIGNQVDRDQAMDIWIAIGTDVQPYPVRIRFTEPNSNRYELTLEKIE